MTRSISSVLRDAALGPAPGEDCSHAAAWIEPDYAWRFVRHIKEGSGAIMPDMTNDERRMFLLFCSYAAEDEHG